jgi:trehalose 6-phosphate synthase/phosphatase
MDTDIEYKYVFLQDFKFTWERLSCNRTLRVTHDSLTVEDEEGAYVSKTYITETCRYCPDSPALPSLGYFPFPGYSEEDHVLIVSFLPPVSVVDSSESALEITFSSVPWLSSLYQSATDAGVDFQWICVLSCSEKVQKVLSEQYHITAISPPEDMLRRHEQFCEVVLEPILQGLIGLNSDDFPLYQTEIWEGYRGVNSLLADAIMRERRGEDLIWLQDYQVMMIASFLGRHQTDPPFNIGLSLHSPFPPSDIFRVLPNREALLNSMLACDLVTFDCFDYLNSFLSACKCVLGAENCYKQSGLAAVTYFGREIAVKTAYCGVNFREIEEIAASEDCQSLLNMLKTEFQGQKVVFGVEFISNSSSLWTKLSAFQVYLKANPASKLTFLHINLRNKRLSKSIQLLYERMQAIVADINTQTCRSAVVLREIDAERWVLGVRLAYLQAAHVYWDSLKGYSPTMVEFAAVHRPSSFPMVISSFSLLVSSFKSAFYANPFDFQEVLEGFQYAERAEADERVYEEREMERLAGREAANWGCECLNSLKQARKNSFEFVFLPLGLGDKLKQVAMRRNFDALLPDKLSIDYKNTRNRLIVLSNEGALMPMASVSRNEQEAKVVQALEELCRDERNSIYVFSDSTKKSVNSVYSSIRNLGLVAEEGSFIKDKYTGFTWQKLATDENTWKIIADETISLYVEFLEGSVKVVKETMVVFSYKHAKQDTGVLIAKELISNLEVALQPYQHECEIETGADCVKVKSSGCNRASILQKISKKITDQKGPIGLILCIGDGPEDEIMFKALHTNLPILSETKRISCTVGLKPSLASHYVHSIQDVWKLVDTLKNHSVKVDFMQTRGSYSQNEILQGRMIGDKNRPILALSISCTQVAKAKDDFLAYDEV